MRLSTCNNDDTLGPSVSGCRGDFDFTIKFEQLVFSIVPSALLIVAVVGRAAWSVRKPVIVHAPTFLSIKLGAIVLYALLKFVLLILVATGPLVKTHASIASNILQLLAATAMFTLSFLDHGRSARPSVLLSSYLFFTLLPDIAQTRTFWLVADTEHDAAHAGVFTASMLLKVFMLFVEAQQKTKWVNWGTEELHSPEETSGIYSLGLYFWLNNLFFSGYRKVLHMEDLYPLDRAIAGANLYRRFQIHADYTKMKGTAYGLAKAVARTLLVPMLLPIPPRIGLIFFKFCQPFLINSILEVISGQSTQETVNYGYGFIGATALIYSGLAVSTALYWYFHFRSLQMARGILITAIYTKTTEAQVGIGDSSAPVTLMSVDIERINFGFQSLHEVWAAGIEVGLASYLLYNELGIAFVAPIVTLIICFLVMSVLVKYTGKAQKSWMTRVQKRVGLTATVIANMKNVKIAGLAGPIFDSIQKNRVDELKGSSRVRQLALMGIIVSWAPFLISPVITFALSERSLDTARVFTALSYLVLLATPLTVVLKVGPQMASGFACLSRMQAHLERNSRDDFRVVPLNSTAPVEKELCIVSPSNNDDKIRPGSAIVVTEATFGWEEGKAVLTDINICIPRSSLTMVVGPIGSGKSTLCKALLGEIPYHRGQVAWTNGIGRVGYCDQAPFLSNCSIRDNIVGFSPFDEERYASVISAAMLEADFEILPRGDSTKIGSNGIILSGGQRQRISLARALYLQTDMLIFDDVLRGLDADTEEQVFKRVFGTNGIIRSRQATAVLCTHSVRHLPSANKIIALNTQGTVTEQGSFEELVANGKYIHRLGVKATENDTIGESTETEESYQHSGLTASRRKAITISTNDPDVPDIARQQGDRRVYKHYFKSMGYLVATIQMVLTALFGFFYNFPTIWLKYWSDSASSAHPSHCSGYYVGIYGLLNICCLLSMVVLAYLVWVLAVRRAGANLHREVLRTLTRAPLRFLTTTDQGVITNLFSQDLNLVDTELPNALLNTLYNLTIAVGQAAVMITATAYIVASYPFIIALMWLIQKLYLRTSRQMRMLDLEAKSPLYTHFLDTTKGIVTLRAFGFISNDRAKNMNLLDDSQRPAYLLFMLQQWLTLVLNFIVMALAVLLVSLAVNLHHNSGFTGASLVTLMSFGDFLSSIVMQWTKLETSIGAIARLQTFNNTVAPEDRMEETIIPGEEWPTNGQIDLREVSATYDDPRGCGEVPNLVINKVSLFIAPGEKVAICGRTGSGKSSMFALLLKLLDPCEGTPGRIYIDGTPLHLIDRTTLRLRIIAIPQEALSLPGGATFRQNLDPFDRAHTDECCAVLKTVDLWSLIQSRGGLDTAMTSDTFSQGQRQLFSLAYAVLRRRMRSRLLGAGGVGSEGGILLLDEVTSSVDQDTERVMQEIIATEFQDYTVVAVSHRLSTIMDFDRVAVMDHGEIVEVGNPRTLVETENTRFGNLWKSGGS
ncbi:ABC transporter [Fonsecaea erecta]|uniref:ABC transporter n=1 Tax=Fonsecaea erecta TaxID=1367422 RepID=A0A178ZRX5_9EURO|nr:ABC transporter [Fonsecaea erecta]OAP62557.1 ABC transporter [Fonsecaea erecta]